MDGGDFLLSNVDKRIVQMEFDNKQFEKDMQVTVKSLHNFEKDLNNVGTSGKAFEGISKGLDNVKANVKGFSLDAVSNAFEKVKVTISGWEMAAMAAITRVVDGAMNAAQNMARSLISDPVREGFKEYELKINAVQTMLLGAQAIDPSVNLEKVNKTLEELNTYADKTIYSFADMKDNVAKFINAGIGLEDSAAAIQGISNWAAVAGANTQQASHTMYNLSQALATGYVQRLDWRSIENAQMNTVEFMREALSIAQEVGTVAKIQTVEGNKYVALTQNNAGSNMEDTVNIQQMFNQGLQYQWLTTEVLTKTLQKYSDETTELGKKAADAATHVKTFSQLMDTLKEAVGSGWAVTWEHIFGDFEESKKLWTEINNVVGGFINKQADARNAILKTWADMGGRATFFEALKNIVTDISEVMKPIQEAFREIFGGLSAGKLVSFSRNLANLSYILEPTKEEILEIKDVFKSLFQFVKSATEPLFRAWKEAFPTGTLISFVRNFTSLIGNVIKSITDAFNALTDNGEVIHNVAFTVFSVLRTGINVLTFLFSIIKSIIKITAPIATFLGKIIGYIVNIVTEIGSLIFKSSAIRDSIVKITNSINKLVDPLKEGLLYAFALLQPHLDRFKEWALSGAKWLGDNIAKGIQFLADKIEKLVGKIKDFTASFNFSKEGIEGAKNKLGEYKDKVTETSNAVVDSIKKNETISNIWNGIKNFFSNVWNGIQDLFQKVQPYVQKALDFIKERFSNAYEEIRKNGLFAATGKSIGSVIGNIGKGLSIMVQNLIPFRDKILEFFGEDSVVKLVKDFVKVFIGLKAGKALDIFKSMGEGLESLTKAINNITTSIQNAMNQFLKKDISKSFKNFAIGIGVLAAALFVVSKIDSKALWPSILALSALITIIAGIFIAVDQITKNSIKAAQRFASMAILLAAFGSSISKILLAIGALIAIMDAVNNPGAIATAIGTVALITLLIGAFVVLFAKFGETKMDPKRILATSLTIKAIGSTIKSIAIVIGILSLFNPGKLLIAGAIIEVLTITILAGLYIMIAKGSSYGLKPAQILAFSLMIKSLGSAIKGIGLIIAILSVFDSAKVLIAATVIGLISIVFAGILKLISDVADPRKMIKSALSILILASALGIISLAIKALSIGDMKNTIAAVIVLVGTFVALSEILIALTVFAKPIQVLSKGLFLFGAAVLAFGAGVYFMVEAVKTLTDLGPNAINLMTEAMTTVVANIPKWIGILIAGLFEYLGKLIPSIVQSLIKVIISIIEGITSGIGSIISAIVKLFKAVVEALSTYSNAFDIKDLFWAVQSIALIAGLIFVLQIISSDMKAALKGIALMAAVLGLLVASLLVINGFTNPTQSIGILQGIATTLVSLAATFAVVGALAAVFGKFKIGFGAIAKAIGAFALFMVAIVAVVGIIGLVAQWLEDAFDMDVVSTIQKGSEIMQYVGEGIGKFMGAITNSMSNAISEDNVGKLLALVPLILALEPLTAVLPILAIFIGAIGAAATAIDEWTHTEGATAAAVQKGAEVMGGMGDALGQFVGGFVNGVMKQFSKGLMDSLITFADGLGTFMDHMNPFLDALNKINGDLLDKTGQLTLIILEMCAAELVNGITGFFSIFTGQKSLAGFAAELEAMAGPLVNFSNKLHEGDFDADTVNRAATAAKIMAETAAILPTTGGVAGWFSGDRVNLKSFGEELEGMGSGLVAFATSIASLTEDDTKRMENAATVIKKLADVANSMPKHGGFLQAFLGDVTNIDDFGVQLRGFGGSLRMFAESVEGITPEEKKAVDQALPIMTELAKFANDMPNANGGVWGKIFGEQMNIKTFGEQLGGFGTGIKSFAQNTEGITEAQVTSCESAIGIATKISELSKALGEDKEGGVVGFFAGTSKETLESFSEKLPKLGYGLRNFAAQVGHIENAETVVPLAEGIKALADAFKYTKDANNFTTDFLQFLADFVNGESSVGYKGDELEKASNLLGEYPGSAIARIEKVRDGIKALSDAFKHTKDANNFSTDFLQFLADLVNGESKFDYKGDELQKAADLLGPYPGAALESIKKVGLAITELGTAFKGVEGTDDFSENFLKSFNMLANTGNKFKTVAGLLGDNPSVAEDNLNKIKRVKTAIATLSEAVNLAVGANAEDISRFAYFAKTLSGLSLTTLKTELADGAGEVIAALNDLIYQMGTAILNKKEPLKNNVNTMLSGFEDAINEYNFTATSKIKELIENCIQTIEDLKGDSTHPLGFYLAGINSISGYVKGIKDKIQDAYNAGHLIGEKALEGANKAVDNRSPSHKFEDYVAYNSVMGFVRGFRKRAHMALEAGEYLGQNALNGTQGIVSRIDNILNSDMNLQPVITPVLDLSQMSIQSGRISGILNANNSVIAAGRASSLIEQGRMLRLDARINQNGSPDVVAAVENLTNRMDSMEEAIINRPIELDGDRVTKKLTPRVDKALGQRAYYSRRGN